MLGYNPLSFIWLLKISTIWTRLYVSFKPQDTTGSQFALTQYLNKGLGCAATDL